MKALIILIVLVLISVLSIPPVFSDVQRYDVKLIHIETRKGDLK